MSLLDFLLRRGRRDTPHEPETDEFETLEHAPVGVWWREVRPFEFAPPVLACRADIAGQLQTRHGAQSYRAGDYIVTHGGGDESVVRASIFERTYRSLGEGRYQKRSDIVLRYFTLDRPVQVRTLEGVEHAAAGDWIMEGVAGELWPVNPEVARAKYKPV